MNIKEEHKKLMEQLLQLNTRVEALRLTCLHPNVVKVNKANTGNYDPSCDRYWRDCTCPDCGKFWMEDQ